MPIDRICFPARCPTASDGKIIQLQASAGAYFRRFVRSSAPLRLRIFAGCQRCRFKSTRNSTTETPSVSRSFFWSKACGPRMRIFPRSPITRCHGMPFPDGVAAMARPAVRAPPGKPRALASPPYVRTLPRGIRCTRRYTLSQDMCRTTPEIRGLQERIAYRRCEHTEEQVKNAVTGFNKMVRVSRW